MHYLNNSAFFDSTLNFNSLRLVKFIFLHMSCTVLARRLFCLLVALLNLKVFEALDLKFKVKVVSMCSAKG